MKTIKGVLGIGLLFIVLCCSRSLPIRLDFDSEQFYQQAHFFMSKDEIKTFLNLPDAEMRNEFISTFWVIRDPDPSTEINEFKQEIETRFQYVQKYLREGGIPGWKTDRGKIYMILGPPSLVENYTNFDSPESEVKAVIFWRYGEEETGGFIVRFDDVQGFGMYRLNLASMTPRVLNMIDNAQGYVMNLSGKQSTRLFQFKMAYDHQKKEVVILIDPKSLTYEKKGPVTQTANLKITLAVYQAQSDVVRFNVTRSLEFSEETLLKSNESIRVTIPLELKKGKSRIDAMVVDLLANRFGRKLFAIKI